MLRRLLLAAALVACLAVVVVSAQDDVTPVMSFMEIGAASTISSQAAKPLQDVARLLVEANRNLQRLHKSRSQYTIESNHISVAHRQHAPKPKQAAAGHVNAQLVPRMEQPTIHDANRFGTKHPIRAGQEFVSAEIVGEDGKPYLPRKQWKGITEEKRQVYRSPFAKFIHPPKVGSSADVVNKDPNTKLNAIERKSIDSLQLRLKQLLDKLGANIVWDHSTVKNRRLVQQFEELKTESRTLMEEYELRTGVKTIAWQLQDGDIKGLAEPNAKVTDIHFANSPQLAGRKLQRPGDRRAPPTPSQAELKAILAAQPGAVAAKPKEQRVSVRWKADADGVVKAKVNLKVVDSKVPQPDQPANLAARTPVAGTQYPSGKVGRPSSPVQIDVVAPRDEELVRNKGIATQAEPKINL